MVTNKNIGKYKVSTLMQIKMMQNPENFKRQCDMMKNLTHQNQNSWVEESQVEAMFEKYWQQFPYTNESHRSKASRSFKYIKDKMTFTLRHITKHV